MPFGIPVGALGVVPAAALASPVLSVAALDAAITAPAAPACLRNFLRSVFMWSPLVVLAHCAPRGTLHPFVTPPRAARSVETLRTARGHRRSSVRRKPRAVRPLHPPRTMPRQSSAPPPTPGFVAR